MMKNKYFKKIGLIFLILSSFAIASGSKEIKETNPYYERYKKRFHSHLISSKHASGLETNESHAFLKDVEDEFEKRSQGRKHKRITKRHMVSYAIRSDDSKKQRHTYLPPRLPKCTPSSVCVDEHGIAMPSLGIENDISALDPSKYGIYIVKRDEDFEKIAMKFHLSIRKLLSINNLQPQNEPFIGDELKIPLKQQMIDDIDLASYTVRKGDTFGSIAKKFHISTKALVGYNRLSLKRPPKTGKFLSLPLPYRLAEIEEKKRIKRERQEIEMRRYQEEMERMEEAQQEVDDIDIAISYSDFGTKQMRVTATAYTSHVDQTDSTPFVAAWNDPLYPGIKAIAVSEDMLAEYGLKHGTAVRIAGLPGLYEVKDKMNRRFKKRIDIYMGVDRKKAMQWGKRSVMIYWD